MEESIRINKYLSEAGFCSRREADRLIESGLVTIDGDIATLGSRVIPGQKVYCNGKAVVNNNSKVVIAYNKPIGIECTADRYNRDNIIDAINYPVRLFTVGRLDKNSCGLILLTNDGELANHISKAGQGHEKEYLVRVDKAITDDFVRQMSKGVPVLDKITAPCRIYKKSEDTFHIVLIQGLNRQIRRMCEYMGYHVKFLKRVRIMNIQLNGLKTGEYRELTADEIRQLGSNM
ncbi:MAG: pseudouridine synthase [Lachnospiraceae bacterium]